MSLIEIETALLRYLVEKGYYIHDEDRNRLQRTEVLEAFFNSLKESNQ